MIAFLLGFRCITSGRFRLLTDIKKFLEFIFALNVCFFCRDIDEMDLLWYHLSFDFVICSGGDEVC